MHDVVPIAFTVAKVQKNLEKHTFFQKNFVSLQRYCENGLHLGNSSELDCTRFAPSLHRDSGKNQCERLRQASTFARKGSLSRD
jgi:hypothetical protein